MRNVYLELHEICRIKPNDIYDVFGPYLNGIKNRTAIKINDERCIVKVDNRFVLLNLDKDNTVLTIVLLFSTVEINAEQEVNTGKWKSNRITNELDCTIGHNQVRNFIKRWKEENIDQHSIT